MSKLSPAAIVTQDCGMSELSAPLRRCQLTDSIVYNVEDIFSPINSSNCVVPINCNLFRLKIISVQILYSVLRDPLIFHYAIYRSFNILAVGKFYWRHLTAYRFLDKISKPFQIFMYLYKNRLREFNAP